MVIKREMDLIKTIEDDEEVENLSEESDVEVEVKEHEKIGVVMILMMDLFSINQRSRSDRRRNTLKAVSSLSRRCRSTTKTLGMI